MIKYNVNQYNTSTSHDKIEVTCSFCGQVYNVLKHNLVRDLKQNKTTRFCSKNCSNLHRGCIPPQEVKCKQCEKVFVKKHKEIKKSENHFCSSSCAAIYNNTHKTHGTKRSKLENYLQEELSKIHRFDILFNDRSIINSELDIYIPSLKLAFEINGIFHYEPIYGVTTYNRILNNDNRKFQACLEKGISLCIIDTSGQKNFNQKSSKQYLDIILSVIQKVINETQYPMSDLN